MVGCGVGESVGVGGSGVAGAEHEANSMASRLKRRKLALRAVEAKRDMLTQGQVQTFSQWIQMTRHDRVQIRIGVVQHFLDHRAHL